MKHIGIHIILGLIFILISRPSFSQENPYVSQIDNNMKGFEQSLESLKQADDYTQQTNMVYFRYFDESKNKDVTIQIFHQDDIDKYPVGDSYTYIYICKDSELGIRFIVSEYSSMEGGTIEKTFFNEQGKTIFYSFKSSVGETNETRVRYYNDAGITLKEKNSCVLQSELGKQKTIKCNPIVIPMTLNMVITRYNLQL